MPELSCSSFYLWVAVKLTSIRWVVGRSLLFVIDISTINPWHLRRPPRRNFLESHPILCCLRSEFEKQAWLCHVILYLFDSYFLVDWLARNWAFFSWLIWKWINYCRFCVAITEGLIILFHILRKLITHLLTFGVRFTSYDRFTFKIRVDGSSSNVWDASAIERFMSLIASFFDKSTDSLLSKCAYSDTAPSQSIWTGMIIEETTI